MKSLLLIPFLMGGYLQAKVYESEGVFTQQSKKEACAKALSEAQVDAMQQAGTVVLSSFSSSQSDVQGKTQKSVEQDLLTMSLGIAKLQHKEEEVSVNKEYFFTCRVKASFEINADELQEQYKELMKQKAKEKKVQGYFEAKGYSEEGQSRYKAFTAAKLVAQRNLLEEIKGAKITSLTKFDSGEVNDKIMKLLNGTLQGAKTISQEYDDKTRSAFVVLQISKQKIMKALDN